MSTDQEPAAADPAAPPPPEKVYSTNEENFCHAALESAAESRWHESDDLEVGQTITIWEGERVKFSASSLLPSIADAMREQAYANVGEFSDVWEFTRADEDSLNEAVGKAVDEWAEANNMHPTFYGVENVRALKVRFIDEEGRFELVGEAEGGAA